MTILAAILLAPTFFLWAALHEGAHLLAVALQREVVDFRIRLYPHRGPDLEFRWAAVEYTYRGTDLGPHELSRVLLAPRVPDMVGAMLLPVSGLLGGVPGLLWGFLVGGGVVDLFVGSLGIREGSDLRRAAEELDVDPWRIRLPGFVIVGVSVFLTWLTWS